MKKWILFEEEKKRLWYLNLSPEEYEKAVKEIAERLGL